VRPSDHREFGRALVDVTASCALFDGVRPVGPHEKLWMSHGDRITRLPSGFRAVAATEAVPV